MLEVENRIARLRRVVIRGQVHEGVTPCPGHAGVVPDLAHLAMRYVLGQIVVDARFGDFYRARPFAASKVGRASGIADLGAIDDDRVVVKAGRHGF